MEAGSVKHMIRRHFRLFFSCALLGLCWVFLGNSLAQPLEKTRDSLTAETNIQGRIIFSSFRQTTTRGLKLWLLNGQALKNLKVGGVNPILSRDGNWLFFNGQEGLYRLDLHGQDLTKPELLSISTVTRVFDYDLSPDRSRICFTTSEISQPKGLYGCNLHIGNLNGTNIRCLTQFSPTDTVGGVNNPKWSPDGDSILFTAFDPTETKGERNVRLWVIKKDGTGLRKIHNELSNYSVNEPAWSPDGKKIAFVARPEPSKPEDYELYICNIDGSNVQRLTKNDWNEREPVFSPDGNQICFVSYRHQKVGMAGFGSELYLINADGTNEQRLTPEEKLPGSLGGWAEDHSPTWGPSND